MIAYRLSGLAALKKMRKEWSCFHLYTLRTTFIVSPEAGSPHRHAFWVSDVKVASRFQWRAFSPSKSFLDKLKTTAVRTIWYHSFTHRNLYNQPADAAVEGRLKMTDYFDIKLGLLLSTLGWLNVACVKKNAKASYNIVIKWIMKEVTYKWFRLCVIKAL